MDLKIFSGRANASLAREICFYLKTDIGEITLKNFSDGEVFAQYKESIRDADVFLIQPTNTPGDNIIELLLMIDAAKLASADKVCAVIPYFGYARQDRKGDSRVSIAAKVMADIIVSAGANRILTIDLHAGQIAGFFDGTPKIPVDHLYARPVFVDYFKNYLQQELFAPLTLVAPDAGAVGMARSYAKRLGDAPIAIIDKRRPEANSVEVLNVVGEVEGRSVLIVDDIVDTAGTLTEGAKELKEQGAEQIFAFCTHGVLSGNAVRSIESSPIEKLFITNTISLSPDKNSKKIEVISVAEIFANAIRRIHFGESVSSLFE